MFKLILNQIILIFIFIALPLPMRAMLCPLTPAGDAMSRQAREWTENFMKREDKYHILGAQAAGFGAELGTFFLGNKYLPFTGAIRIRNITIPTKTFFAGCAAKFAGYTPPIGTFFYLQSKNQQTTNAPSLLENWHKSIDTRFNPNNI